MIGFLGQLHDRCYWPCRFELHYLLEVVSNSGHQHAFVSEFYSACVHSFHRQKIDECAKHRLYSTLPEFLHLSCVRCFQSLVHFIIVGFVEGVNDFFFPAFAYAG